MIRSILLLSALLVTSCHCGEREDCDGPRSHGGGGRADARQRPDHDDRCDGRDDLDDAAPATDAVASGACRLDRDCAAAGAGLVCDVRSGACVTPPQCTADSTCAAGERCLAGRCLGPAAVCQFATDCTAGRDCVDGRCLAPCSASSACPSTQTCVSGRCDQPTQGGSQCVRAADCGAGSVCADGRCVAACDPTHGCAAGQVCVTGFCQADTAPRSFCTRDSDCATGSVCRRGSCRAACPAGTAAECLRVDVTFDTCGGDLLCTNPLEMRPECARSADCSAPTICINARCR